MGDFLKKSELKFALKVSLLLTMVVAASILKQNNNEKKLVKNMPIELPVTVFANF